MYEPLVSIIIPIYNSSEYLNQCLDSTINQTYHNLEIILVDDGSTDDSGDICEKYAKQDSRFVVIHKTNEGPSSARNIGLKKMTGEYVVFVDSDDYIDRQFIELLLSIALKYNMQLVIGSYKKFTNIYQLPLSTKRKILENNLEKYTSREAMLNTLYRKNLTTYSPGKLYSSTLFQKIQFPEGRLYDEDVVVTWELIKKIDYLIYVNLPLYYYRQRSGSIINTSFHSRRMEQLSAARDIMAEVRHDEELYNAAVSKYFFCLTNLYAQVDNKHQKEKYILETQLKKYASLIKTNPQNRKAFRLLACIGLINVYPIRIIGKGYKLYNKLKWKIYRNNL